MHTLYMLTFFLFNDMEKHQTPFKNCILYSSIYKYMNWNFPE